MMTKSDWSFLAKRLRKPVKAYALNRTRISVPSNGDFLFQNTMTESLPVPYPVWKTDKHQGAYCPVLPG